MCGGMRTECLLRPRRGMGRARGSGREVTNQTAEDDESGGCHAVDGHTDPDGIPGNFDAATYGTGLRLMVMVVAVVVALVAADHCNEQRRFTREETRESG